MKGCKIRDVGHGINTGSGNSRGWYVADNDIEGIKKTDQPSDDDLRLTRNAECIDAGVALPQVTDNYRGNAPDLGCHEFGQTPPHYGPLH